MYFPGASHPKRKGRGHIRDDFWLKRVVWGGRWGLGNEHDRVGHTATLHMTGRDYPDGKIYLVRNEELLTWELDHEEKDLWREPPDPILDAVAAILEVEWIGTPTDLIQRLGVNAAEYFVQVLEC